MIKKILFIAACVSFTTVQAQLEKKLKAYYSFDSANLRDQVGSLDLNAASATYGSDRFNVANQSLLFSASGNKQASVEDSIMDLGNDFSISFWFKVNSNISSNGHNLVSSRKSKTNMEMGAVEILVWRDSHIYCNVRNFFTELSELRSTTQVLKDTWYHIALVRKADSTYLYVNNQLEHKLPLSTSFNVSPAVFWALGSDGGNATRILNGNIDDVRFFNDDLNAAEIDTLYRAPLNANSIKGMVNAKWRWLMVYPNPSKGVVTFNDQRSLATSTIKTVSLYDLQGMLLLKQFFADEITLSLKQWKAGNYFAVIENEKGEMQSLKVILL